MKRDELRDVAELPIDTVPRSVRRSILSLARQVGVKVDLTRDPRKGWQWDGVRISAGRQNVDSVIHDIAHYVVCPKDRLHMKDFGLGRGPESGSAKSLKRDAMAEAKDPAINWKDSQAEEAMASALGIYYEFLLGIDPIWALGEHNWIESGGFFAALSKVKRGPVRVSMVRQLKKYTDEKDLGIL